VALATGRPLAEVAGLEVAPELLGAAAPAVEGQERARGGAGRRGDREGHGEEEAP
jgi:hypothetical protein